jgi:hypothetical protein
MAAVAAAHRKSVIHLLLKLMEEMVEQGNIQT